MVKVTTDKALDFYMNDRYEFNKLYYEDNPIFSPCLGIDWSFNVKDWGKANYFLTTNFYWKVPKLKKYRVTLRINCDYTDECEAMSEEEAEDIITERWGEANPNGEIDFAHVEEIKR